MVGTFGAEVPAPPVQFWGLAEAGAFPYDARYLLTIHIGQPPSPARYSPQPSLGRFASSAFVFTPCSATPLVVSLRRVVQRGLRRMFD